MNGDEKHAATLMHAALTDFLAYAEDPNMPTETLKERAAQAVVRVTAPDEALDRAFLRRALKSARFAQFLAVALRALPQRARARVAGVVDAFFLERIAALRTGLPLAWFALPSHTGQNTPAAARRDRNPAGQLLPASRAELEKLPDRIGCLEPRTGQHQHRRLALLDRAAGDELR